jgi:hypothetical protein
LDRNEDNNTARLTQLNVRCLAFKPYQKGTLRGYARVQVALPCWGMELAGVAVHRLGDKSWAQPPSKARVEDDELVRRSDGRLAYSPVIYLTPETRRSFSAAVATAVGRFVGSSW